MRSLLLSLAMVVTGCGGARASSTTPSVAPASANNAPASGVSLTLPQYTAAILEAGLPEVCGTPESILRRCFTVDEAQCRQHFRDAMMACSAHEGFNWPAMVTEANAEATSQGLAGCAGLAYIGVLNEAGLMRQTPECRQ